MPYDSSDGLRVARVGTAPLPALERVTGPLSPAVLPAAAAPAPKQDQPVMPAGLAAVLGTGSDDDGAVELLNDVTRHARRAERLFREVAEALRAMRLAGEGEGGDGVLVWEPPPVSWFDTDTELAVLAEQQQTHERAAKSQVILGGTGNLVRTIGL